jgi:hypothetical protein
MDVCLARRRHIEDFKIESVPLQGEEVLSFYRPELGYRRLEAVPRMRRHRSVAQERRPSVSLGMRSPRHARRVRRFQISNGSYPPSCAHRDAYLYLFRS